MYIATSLQLAAAGLCLAVVVPPVVESFQSADTVSVDTKPDWVTLVADSIALEEYQYSQEGRAAHAPNRGQGLRSWVSSEGLRVEPREGGAWALSLRTTTYGAKDDAQPLAAGQPQVHGNRVEIARGPLVEWYVNDARGIEHGWTLLEAPVLDAWIGLEVSGMQLAISDDGLGGSYRTGDGEVRVRMAGLRAWDADGQPVAARFEAGRDGAGVRVDLRAARLPVTVDPVLTGPAWLVESDQAGAALGFAVASAGDVNGDGISDAIVGVPNYDNGQVDEGRVYVYHGSATGLATTPAAIFESNQANALFGSAVAGLGDLSGDGRGEIAVGAPNYDAGQTDEGVVFVYLGSANGPTDLGSIGLQVDQAAANFGSSVAALGDASGDGVPDLIVGAPNFDQGQTNEGVAFIFRGTGTSSVVNLQWTLLQNINDGTATNAAFGSSVAGAGDVNRDGVMDIVVGSPSYSAGQANEGAAYVWHGRAWSFGAAPGPNWIYESQQAGARFGAAVAGAGDVNSDGYADILVGAPQGTNGAPLAGEGLAFLFAGSASGMPLTGALWLGQIDQAGASFGASVATAGDANGDGYADIVVGAPDWDGDLANEGRVVLYLGGASGPALQPSLSFEGDAAGAGLGNALAGLGDANNDGFGDVIVGARAYANGQAGEGQARAYYGASFSVSSAPIWNELGLQNNGDYATSIAMVGDLNGDGYSDFVVSAYREDLTAAGLNEGRVYVYRGGPFSVAPVLLGTVNGITTADPTVANDQFGNCVAGAGDVNGDGYDDFIVGARLADDGEIDEGKVYVFHGAATGFNSTPAAVLQINQAGANFGHWVSGAGDVNGDGHADIVVGAHLYDGPQGSNTGGAWLYLGGASGVSSSSAWSAAGSAPNLNFGANVAAAGDVNGDGYADVLVGSYDSTTLGQGSARLYYGSAAGLGAPAFGFTTGQNQAHISTVAGLGDINGDGYSDFALGSPQYDGGAALVDEGRVYIFHGSATFPAATPNLVLPGGQAGAQYGFVVASAGDLNADGYSDVLVTSRYWDAQAVNEGRAFAYLGSTSGATTVAYWEGEVGQSNSEFGLSCAGAGDVNGDGFGDLLVGALDFDFISNQAGAAFLYCGNGIVRGGPALVMRQLRQGGAPIPAQAGIPEVNYRLQVLAAGHAGANTPGGRAKVRLASEQRGPTASFSGTQLQLGPQAEIGAGGAEVRLESSIQGTAGGLNRWRARVKTNLIAFPHGIWLSLPSNGWRELDLRTPRDCNANGVPDAQELAANDCNGNGTIDSCDIADGNAFDCDSDGLLDSCEIAAGARDFYGRNGAAIVCAPDGVPDSCQATPPVADCDDDGIPNVCEIASGARDTYGASGQTVTTCLPDGVPDSCQQVPDCDVDGTPNFCEIQGGGERDRYGWNGTVYTCAADGIPDSCQTPPAGWDCDNDGLPNFCEIQGGAADRYGFNGQAFTCSSDGVPDSCQTPSFPWDCDNDGTPTFCEIAGGALDLYGYNGSTFTCAPDGVQDSCQTPSFPWDCDADGNPNFCELQQGARDVYGLVGGNVVCQPNGVPDSCESAPDCDVDGLPNLCELATQPDCNGNGIQDSCDIASGFALDCNANAIPDSCDLAAGAADCNQNQRPDSCDIASGASQDANSTQIPDECEAVYTPYCFGLGGGACPCGNVSTQPGNGCPNALNPAGANLRATGLPSAQFCTLQLQGSGMPPAATVLYFQGTAIQSGGNGIAFGDGLRCASGTVLRLGIVTNVNGASTFPAPGGTRISLLGQIPAAGGVTRYYQGWYRDQNPNFCTASRFNLTNGLAVQWLP